VSLRVSFPVDVAGERQNARHSERKANFCYNRLLYIWLKLQLSFTNTTAALSVLSVAHHCCYRRQPARCRQWDCLSNTTISPFLIYFFCIFFVIFSSISFLVSLPFSLFFSRCLQRALPFSSTFFIFVKPSLSSSSSSFSYNIFLLIFYLLYFSSLLFSLPYPFQFLLFSSYSSCIMFFPTPKEKP